MNKKTFDPDTQELLKVIGENIRRIRKEKGISQEKLANETDVNLTYLGYIENAKYNVTIGKLNTIAKYLGVTIEVIVKHQE